MAEIARACGFQRRCSITTTATRNILYDIAAGHVEDLLAIVADVGPRQSRPRGVSKRLILRFMGRIGRAGSTSC